MRERRGSPSWLVYDPENPREIRIGPLIWNTDSQTIRYNPALHQAYLASLQQAPRELVRKSQQLIPYPMGVAKGDVSWIRLYQDRRAATRVIMAARIGARGVRWFVKKKVQGGISGPMMTDHPIAWMNRLGEIILPGFRITPDGKTVPDRSATLFRVVRDKSGTHPGTRKTVLYLDHRMAIYLESVASAFGGNQHHLRAIRQSDGKGIMDLRISIQHGVAFSPDGIWAAVTQEPGGDGKLLIGRLGRVLLESRWVSNEFDWGGLRLFPMPGGLWAVLSDRRIWVVSGEKIRQIIPLPTVILRTFPQVALLGSVGTFLLVPDTENDLREVLAGLQNGTVIGARHVSGKVAVMYGNEHEDRANGLYLYPSGAVVDMPVRLMEASHAGVMVVSGDESDRNRGPDLCLYGWNGKMIHREAVPVESSVILFPTADETFIYAVINDGTATIRRRSSTGAEIATIQNAGWNGEWRILKIVDTPDGRVFQVGDQRPARLVIAESGGGVFIKLPGDG